MRHLLEDYIKPGLVKIVFDFILPLALVALIVSIICLLLIAFVYLFIFITSWC